MVLDLSVTPRSILSLSIILTDQWLSQAQTRFTYMDALFEAVIVLNIDIQLNSYSASHDN